MRNLMCHLKSAMSTLANTEKNITVKAQWGKIAAITWGNSSNPPVLLCPGRMVPCSSFRPLIKHMPDCFFYVAIDLPGSGLSDHLPPGIRYTVLDLLPSIAKVVEHFKWEKIMFIGHSLGTVIGTYFTMAYPNRVTRFVQLDPIPLYHTVTPETFESWYKEYYRSNYDDDQYVKHTSGRYTAPRYSLDVIKRRLMAAHKINEETLEHVLDRYIEPAGDGLYRFTYDQRMKNTTTMPFSPDNLKLFLTSAKIPILAIFAKFVIDAGVYSKVPFAFDTKAWPHDNYGYKIVSGYHDVHMSSPELMADDIAKFLLQSKAKL
ncbi:serine hydrolase-like protein isoform X1 [Pieris brassicae]|uniref:serine hydrolase-like protein isoform X1 n=2 Tax=Pieris brassicae TaxID=7116 RepID=UPI001E66143C|nr:serine hydrolase-like protein isoform X1 [Pieris brassicae]